MNNKIKIKMLNMKNYFIVEGEKLNVEGLNLALWKNNENKYEIIDMESGTCIVSQKFNFKEDAYKYVGLEDNIKKIKQDSTELEKILPCKEMMQYLASEEEYNEMIKYFYNTVGCSPFEFKKFSGMLFNTESFDLEKFYRYVKDNFAEELNNREIIDFEEFLIEKYGERIVDIITYLSKI